MAQKTDAQLQTQRAEIEGETVANANTAARVGQMFEDEIDSKANNGSYTTPSPQFTTATSTTAYEGTPSPAITAYATGQRFFVKIHATSTGAATLNLNSIGAKKIFVNPTTQAGTDHLLINQVYLMAYDTALDAAAGGFLIVGSGSTSNTATALTDGAAITITGAKHTLTTDEATITFSDSYTGDFTSIDVTFNTTSATWTFPAGSLCVVEGSASGNNTATVTGVSGDKVVISIWFVSSGNYRIAIKNFGQ